MARQRKLRRFPTGMKALKPISKGAWKRAIRNKRCKIVSGDEGGTTYRCGKKILVSDHVADRYYRMTGATAMYSAYMDKHYGKAYRDATRKRK